jgi:hypothetical protein
MSVGEFHGINRLCSELQRVNLRNDGGNSQRERRLQNFRNMEKIEKGLKNNLDT